MGKWQGIRIQDVEREYPKEHYLYFNEPESYVFLGGENFDELFIRVKSILKEIIDIEDEFVSVGVYTGTSLTVFAIDENKIECIL